MCFCQRSSESRWALKTRWTSWFNGLVDPGGPLQVWSFHPNLLGQKAYADLFKRYLKGQLEEAMGTPFEVLALVPKQATCADEGDGQAGQRGNGGGGAVVLQGEAFEEQQ